MTEPNPRSDQTPTDLMEDMFYKVAQVQTAADPPGNEWNFALGVLFALCCMGHLDNATIGRYEERIQAEATRIHTASKKT